MFAKIIVFVALYAVVYGAALQEPEPVPILSQESDISPDGSFQWKYEAGDGSGQEQQGQLKQIGEEAGQAVQGSVHYTDPEGQQHQFSYVADENGYQPQGSDIPQAPEIPAAIARALAWNEAHPEEAAEQKP
ncbi:larval cuticle protein 65Ag1-like [Sitophilus oryzae]|uniref:Larval cuticle protein 65Ag1-like n=1 Tax=Sitophilus oryzae TaxID=7048 RepID=A0A6J2Y343_SITOR|nr:larval cuticle protein 65Ag1-like [Sitophilus oryzae]